MIRNWLAAVAAVTLLTVIGVAVAPTGARAGDPAFISIGAGYFDFNRRKDKGAELRLEYRSDVELWHFKPFVAVGGATSGHGFVGAGLLLDVYFGRRFVMTPSFAPHYYFGGDNDLDLDYPLQFRTQVEFAYRFDNRSRLGLAVSHYSNASLGDTNPGTESAIVYYSIPVGSIFRN